MPSVSIILTVLLHLTFTAIAFAIPVGAAKLDITPDYPTLLAGYAGRSAPSEGVDERLWARALAMGNSNPVVVIAVDNCGVPKTSCDQVAKMLEISHGLPRDRTVVMSTHTHNAPVLTGYAVVLWSGRISEEQVKTMERYTRWLEEQLVKVARKALDSRIEGKLAWGQGRVTFGGNRRVLNANGWQGFGFQIDKPVDHSMPLLLATGADGDPIAAWCNYACHCTTLGARNHLSGDWAGFANTAVEEQHPDAIALTTIGCGADVGPQPSGGANHAREHGESIAREIQRLIQEDKLKTLSEPLRSAAKTVQLPFAPIPNRSTWEETLKSGGFDGELARQQLAQLDRGEVIATHLPYTITTWNFGHELGLVFLPGEVCVDYALRLKTVMDWQRLWINGWANDVPCYIPSKRILAEGGYEADSSMIYYNQPTRFAPSVEDIIVSGVCELLGSNFEPAPETELAPFFVHPLVTGESSQPPPTLGNTDKDTIRQQLAKFSTYFTKERLAQLSIFLTDAKKGFARSTPDSRQTYDSWHTFSGVKRLRPYIRQTAAYAKRSLTWETSDLSAGDSLNGFQSLVFAGGLGWSSEPATEGFILEINGKPCVRFDVTREPKEWTAKADQVQLLYLPTWTSSTDSGGFFFLTAPNRLLHNTSGPTTLGVRSLGKESRRWFALDRFDDCRQYFPGLLECIPGK